MLFFVGRQSSAKIGRHRRALEALEHAGRVLNILVRPVGWAKSSALRARAPHQQLQACSPPTEQISIVPMSIGCQRGCWLNFELPSPFDYVQA